MSLPLLYPLWLAASLAPPVDPSAVDSVEMPWARYRELTAAERQDPLADAQGPWVSQREIELRPAEGGWDVVVEWTVQTQRPGWIWKRVFGPTFELRSLNFDGHAVAIVPLSEGPQIATWIESSGTLRAHAFLPGSADAPIDLDVLEATTGRLRVLVPDRVPVARASREGDRSPPLLDDGVLWSGAPTLSIELRDPDHVAPPRDTLAVAHAGIGLTVGDAELRGRAHLQWELRHGSLDRVRATVSDLGDDLTIEGRDVSTWERHGDTIEVELSSPATGRVDLDLQWTRAVAAGDESSVAIPRIEPDAWRTESTLQVARDGELEVIPQPKGWTAVASSELPTWGSGLVEGTPAAAYQRATTGQAGTLSLLRFVPVPGPPTVVDVATYTVATTQEGRVLMRAHYQLRNDRAGHLTVRPPPGMKIIGARVASETALPSRDKSGAWRIPLKRSLETVEGLLSFPVEVIIMGEDDTWDRRERRQMPLPTLNAPIAASRVTLHLPPSYDSRLDVGAHNVVKRFDESKGVTYGVGAGQLDAAQADALFQQAVDGYLSNDFKQAQQTLEELEQLGVKNQNMARLQSNIDVIEGKADQSGADDDGDNGVQGGEVALQRRVKEQARARATEQFAQQEKLIVEAERSSAAGNYDEAEAQYKAALDLGGTLAKLEQRESVEQKVVNDRVAFRLKDVGRKNKKKRKRARPSKSVSRRDGERSSINASKIGTSFGNESVNASPPDESKTKASVTAVTTSETTAGGAPIQSSDKNGGADGQFTEVHDMTVTDEPNRMEATDFELAQAERKSLNAPEPTEEAGPEDTLRYMEEPAPEPEPERDALPPLPDAPPVSLSRGDAMRISVVQGKSRRRRIFGGKGRRRGRKAKTTSASAAKPMPSAPMGSSRPSSAPQALPAPKVTASAVAVVIPATGQAVRYEQLLIEANHTQTVTIDARRRLRRPRP